jgi:16S rRNA processing protein RimM
VDGPAYLIVGRIRRAHGIRGEVVVEGLTGDPEQHFAVGAQLLAGTADGAVADPRSPGPHTLTVRRAKPFKNGWILRLAEIPDRNAAELWRDRYLLVSAGAVKAPATDEVYYHDLIGMRVEDGQGRPLGTVVELYEVPQGVLLEVDAGTQRVMLPYRPEVVQRADVARRVLVVDPPDGMLDVNETKGEQSNNRTIEQSNDPNDRAVETSRTSNPEGRSRG